MSKFDNETAYMRKLVIDNINKVDSYDLSEIAKIITIKNIEEQIGFYPKGSTLFSKGEVFDFSKTVESNVARFNEFINLNFQGLIENFNWIYHNESLFFSYFFRKHENGKPESYSIAMRYAENNLFYFLRMVIHNGKNDLDLTEANKLADYWSQHDNNATLPLHDENEPPYFIDAKLFNNGRLDIKGLKPEHQLKIAYLIKYANEKRNNIR